MPALARCPIALVPVHPIRTVAAGCTADRTVVDCNQNFAEETIVVVASVAVVAAGSPSDSRSGIPFAEASALA